MKLRIIFSVAVVMAMLGGTARANVVWHDPWLNWDFINMTGVLVNDFEIIVDDPNGTYSPNGNDPTQVMKGPFPNFSVTNIGDYDGDGDPDKRLRWSGFPVNPGGMIHGGLYMLNSGRVLDAYWTFNGNKVGLSTAITYEQTEIRGDPEVHMHLNIAGGWFEDHPGEQAGWVNIRTFVNLPASMLDLEDINESLDLNSLAAFEVQPMDASTMLPILPGQQVLQGVPDSFFDVFLDSIGPEFANPGYEALLYAQVLNQGAVIGQFWNLNPQSPEPASVALLGLGGLMLFKRRN